MLVRIYTFLQLIFTCTNFFTLLASIPIRREYIAAVNKVTQSTLSSLARARPIFIVFTNPLTSGLTVNSYVANAENASIAKLGEPITVNGMGMRLLSKALTSIVNKWEDAQYKFREIENADCVWEWISGRNNCAGEFELCFNLKVLFANFV